MAELALGILAGYGVADRYSIFSKCEVLVSIFFPRITLKHLILILRHVINIPNKEAVLKWCLDRADIAKNIGELKKMAGVWKQYNIC